MSSFPQNWESAISILVPAVFWVFTKMNLCLYEMIITLDLTYLFKKQELRTVRAGRN